MRRITQRLCPRLSLHLSGMKKNAISFAKVNCAETFSKHSRLHWYKHSTVLRETASTESSPCAPSDANRYVSPFVFNSQAHMRVSAKDASCVTSFENIGTNCIQWRFTLWRSYAAKRGTRGTIARSVRFHGARSHMRHVWQGELRIAFIPRFSCSYGPSFPVGQCKIRYFLRVEFFLPHSVHGSLRRDPPDVTAIFTT